MSLFRIQAAVDKLLVVFFDITHMRSFQQVVTGVHFDTDRVQSLYNLGNIRYNGILTVGQLGKEMMFYHRIDAELHFLRVHQHKLQFRGMLLIEQGSNDGIQPDRLTLTGSTGHEHVGHFTQIHHKDLIGNGLAQCNGQVVRRLLKLLTADDALARDNLRIGIRHFNTDCSLSRYRSNDTDAQRGKAECNIIFQTAYLGDTDTLFRCNLIQRHRRAHRSFNGTDFDTEAAQRIDNLILIGILLCHIDSRFGIVIMLHQVNGRIMIVFQVKTRVIRLYFRTAILFILHSLHFKDRTFFLLLSRCRNSGNGIGRRSLNRHKHFIFFFFFGK